MVQSRVDRSAEETMTRLLFIRHGESSWNRSRRLQGCLDSNLSQKGRSQAAAVAARLKDINFTALCASPLGRAAETARAIAVGRDLRIDTYDALREIDYGEWQGQSVMKIVNSYGRWLQNPLRGTPPGGESLHAFVKRVGRALNVIASKGGTIGIVTHGGVIRASICHYFQLPLANIWSLEVSNVSITEIRLRGNSPVLCRLNDASHVSVSYEFLRSISA
jgi:broad specificity phosphatase PhoE